KNAGPPIQTTFTKLTEQAGVEEQATLSPDGKMFAYVATLPDTSDIYVQRVGGHNPLNLTKDSPQYYNSPAFSPHGDQIAFRSERDNGGLFVMGATGESVKRLTTSGYYPAWSPDGKEIVFCTEQFYSPYNRGGFSELWVVNVASGEKRKLFQGDAVQP